MKYLICLFVSVLLFFGCKKDTPDPSTPKSHTVLYELIATIGGTVDYLNIEFYYGKGLFVDLRPGGMTYWSSGNLTITSPASLKITAAATMLSGGKFVAKITVDGVVEMQAEVSGTGPYLNVAASYDLND
jgi:hypothetical protein